MKNTIKNWGTLSKEHALHVDLESMTCSLLLQLHIQINMYVKAVKYICLPVKNSYLLATWTQIWLAGVSWCILYALQNASRLQTLRVKQSILSKTIFPNCIVVVHNNQIDFTDLILENNLLLRSLPKGRKILNLKLKTN